MSSKRPALDVYFEYICWKLTGRLLDRVNTSLLTRALIFPFHKKLPFTH